MIKDGDLFLVALKKKADRARKLRLCTEALLMPLYNPDDYGQRFYYMIYN